VLTAHVVVHHRRWSTRALDDLVVQPTEQRIDLVR